VAGGSAIGSSRPRMKNAASLMQVRSGPPKSGPASMSSAFPGYLGRAAHATTERAKQSSAFPKSLTSFRPDGPKGLGLCVLDPRSSVSIFGARRRGLGSTQGFRADWVSPRALRTNCSGLTMEVTRLREGAMRATRLALLSSICFAAVCRRRPPRQDAAAQSSLPSRRSCWSPIIAGRFWVPVGYANHGK
jgi:hypothetical protein